MRLKYFRMGLQSSTPEIQVTDGQAHRLGYVDITHSDVSVSQRIKVDSPDSNGPILMSIDNVNKLDMNSSGSDVYGSAISTGTLTFAGTGNCSTLVTA